MDKDKQRVSLLVLNDFLKFDRKIYQLFGLNLGRPIKIKTLLYFILFIVIELIVYFTPVIGNLINWMPAVFLILIPAFLAYLLSDIRTEGRNSVAFFRSVFLYHIRKFKRVTYVRGREVAKPYRYKLIGYSTVTFAEDRPISRFNSRKVKIRGKAKVTNYQESTLLFKKGE
ncbi:TcpE family conjugal transfer membrane protein [Cytobacillus horneckiae]|uniref:Conjugal transfer protein n=1 Tax=Cytobacillus horneckiae TaxID=549687 RepID=A0A2N0ZB13_9BACI|nr:TcpE family conjugal transfer membrane protein [Cytobacillus horneckiae]MEC1158701.1 TcpE family conjugal transfer membrane protein [Cytobacillus horneckiae]NRG46659.1 hypothetical protein [Bacillus sp. CRN 9]PKG26689.1 hypothetical protein CWS20_22845 [Cytobacillus horneckiae]